MPAKRIWMLKKNREKLISLTKIVQGSTTLEDVEF